MRYLVLSDIHSNWHALEAVLAHADGHYDQVVCCGDLIGYGADPNAVVFWVRTHCSAVVRGNHDRACTGLENLEWFNPVARRAALWTQEQLSVDNTEYARSLPKGPLPVENFELLHGSPVDEDDYMVSATDAGESFGYLQSRVAFFGHTHVQGGFLWNRSRVELLGRVSSRSEKLRLDLDPECAYMLNPGSVGQPRDGDPRAAYLLYNSDDRRLFYRRVAYDIEAAQRKIQNAGLPSILADHLAVGR